MSVLAKVVRLNRNEKVNNTKKHIFKLNSKNIFLILQPVASNFHTSNSSTHYSRQFAYHISLNTFWACVK